MRCTDFELLASAYLDEELTVEETASYVAHLRLCSPCRAHLEETRAASSLLRSLPTPQTPRELRSYIMNSLEPRLSGKISLRQRLNEFFLGLNPKPLSYATGLVISVMMFSFTLSGFKPIPVTTESVTAKVDVLWIEPHDTVSSDQAEFFLYNNLPLLASANNKNYYELPHVNDPSSLISFSHIAYQKPGDEEMTVMVTIGKDGYGKLERVIDEPSDPTLVEQFWWMLGKSVFQPAIVNGQPVTTNIVMFTAKMDVDGESR